MLTFEYEARDSKTRKHVKADIQAESETAAAKLLLSQGIVPTKIHVKGESKSILGQLQNHVTAKDRIVFTRQLSTLINAGLPLAQSLRTVAGQTGSKPLTIVVNDIIAGIEGGNSLSSTLAKHPKVFNDVYIALVAAGETSGTLDTTLDRLANQEEHDAEMISKVRGAMIYPAIVLFVIFGVVIFMLVEVLPQVKSLYKDLGQTLPFITASMLAVSDFITHFWWLLLALLAGGIYFLNRWRKTDGGTAFFDRFKMNVPLFGPLFMKLYMARFCRTGQSLMASGVQMLEMLRITGRAVDNVHVQAALMRAADSVKGGKALSESIAKDEENFLPLVGQMINIGEQSGQLDTMMGKAADFYENELDNTIKSISTLIEPILMVVLALIAGLLVGAILLPIYGLVGKNLGG
jgi:type IV pilus assembly protein PilC